MGRIILETKGLKKYYKTGAGTLHALDDVDIRIEAGETLGVVGESGCGKSTLGHSVLRLTEPTSGEVYFDSQDIMKKNRKEMTEIRRKMQIIFQDPYSSLNPRLMVRDLIAEPLKVNKLCKSEKEIDERVFSIMKTVGLSSRTVNMYPHELDGGRRQRIGIARALILNPEFIVCDEPVSALDVSIQAQILNLLMDLRDKHGYSYMFITHDLSVVKHISDKILVMYMGKSVEYATADELFREQPERAAAWRLSITARCLAAMPVRRSGCILSAQITTGHAPMRVRPAFWRKSFWSISIATRKTVGRSSIRFYGKRQRFRKICRCI